MPTGSLRALAAMVAVACVLSAATPVAAKDERNCPIAPPAGEPRIERAVSLKGLQAEAEACQSQGSCPEAVLRMYGLTRIEGYVVDRANRDIVLYGAVEDGAPPLYTEDLVVALRNTAKLYVTRERDGTRVISSPAVSIDPSPKVIARLHQIVDRANGSAEPNVRDRAMAAWCETCKLTQDVRVLGIPFDTRFADVMVKGDYLMKQVADGTADLDLAGFASLSEMYLQQHIDHVLQRRKGPMPSPGMTRFWFHPGENTYREDDGVVLIQRSDVILLDEQEHLTHKGKIEAAGHVNPLARTFSCAFSRRYREIAARHPIYAELEALFRWVALVRVLDDKRAFGDAVFDARFFLAGFAVPEVPVPRQLAGIADVKTWDHVIDDGRIRQQISLRLPSCGGVSIRIDSRDIVWIHDASGWLAGTATRILNSRPAHVVSWVVLRG